MHFPLDCRGRNMSLMYNVMLQIVKSGKVVHTLRSRGFVSLSTSSSSLCSHIRISVAVPRDRVTVVPSRAFFYPCMTKRIATSGKGRIRESLQELLLTEHFTYNQAFLTTTGF